MWPFKTVRILSIDGGGIRGLIPALVIRELASRMQAAGRTRPLHSCFDLIAGTSTGALIALGLTLPSENGRDTALSIEDIVAMYRDSGQRIFPPWKFRALHSIAHMFSEKYDIENFDEFLGPVFAEATLQDALSDLLITSFDIERNTSFFFKKRKSRTDDTNFLMNDVAKAAAAAPSYFEPAIIAEHENPENSFCLIDGGVYANNPAMCAYIETRKLYPNAWRYEIVSIGTGKPSAHLSRDEIVSWGFGDWISPLRGAPLFGVMSAGQSEAVDYQLGKLRGVDYYRVNGAFEGAPPEIDDASEENIARLSATAERIIEENDRVLTKLARRL